MCKIYSKLTIKTNVFVSLLLIFFVLIVNYCEHISHIGVVFPLLPLNNLNKYEMLLNKRVPSRHSLVENTKTIFEIYAKLVIKTPK